MKPTTLTVIALILCAGCDQRPQHGCSTPDTPCARSADASTPGADASASANSGSSSADSGSSSGADFRRSSADSGSAGGSSADSANAGGGSADSGTVSSHATIEGFGARALGHKGCASPQTYRVTTLADRGPGSLRDAVSKGCRRVVFDVGGTITLTDDLAVEVSFLTIDGKTAPSPGITIDHPNKHYKVVIAAGNGDVHDVIVRYLRHTGPGGHDETSQDFWGFDAKSAAIYNIVLDHMTMTGSNDGIFDFAHKPGRTAYRDITISWSFIHTQSRATSIRGVKGISYHHNVMARIDDRQPKMTGDTEAEYVNNVTYAWGYICHRSTVAGLSLDSDETRDPKVIARDSAFASVTTKCGDNPDRALWYQSGVGNSKLYTRGNILPAAEKERGNASSPPITVPSWAQVTTYPGASLGDRVVPCVGTVYRTASERALLDEVSKAVGGKGGACANP